MSNAVTSPVRVNSVTPPLASPACKRPVAAVKPSRALASPPVKPAGIARAETTLFAAALERELRSRRLPTSIREELLALRLEDEAGVSDPQCLDYVSEEDYRRIMGLAGPWRDDPWQCPDPWAGNRPRS